MKTNNIDFLLKKGDRQQEEHEGFSDAFLKYLRYWKWFVASIIICLALAVLYLKITPPTYEVRAKILLENTSDENTSFIKSLGLFNLKNNTDNELEVLTTSFLMEQVVRKLDIYAQYYKAERYKKIELYGKDCPISIKLSDASLDNFKGRQNFTVELRPNAVYMFSGIFDNKEYRIRATSEDSLVVLPFGTIEFSSTNYEQKGFMMIDVTLENPARVADHLIGSMNVSLASQTTTVINLALRTSNVKKGIDILNTFLETYKEEDLKDKTMMAKATATYLETLLGPLGGELSDAELKVENFKQREGVTD
ncbi:MAG: Wzz/FepE/Etk N-terminal domain-containing protein, partial [Bacteroidota bacterium]|nr:Wzz/FepE/Etk N-terminal domain-containing protein [Bacteroidota bacterium]